jgi:uncharacterized protein DUF5906
VTDQKTLLENVKGEQDKKKQREKDKAAVREYLEDPQNERLYFVSTDNKFYRHLPTRREWVHITTDGLRNENQAIASKTRFALLKTTLRDNGRVYATKTYADPRKGSVPGEALNLMIDDHWLKPNFERSENTKFFDYLLYTIGNYKEENVQHILQVIGWKYENPGEYRLPCLCLYGEGGAGKNLFATTIMSVIFGESQCLPTKFKQIERWNGVLGGKMVVLFDEHPNKEDQDGIKSIVGNPVLNVELKGVNTFTIDNLALYIIATNNENSPIRLEKNGSDRRWSMIKSELSLISVIQKEEGLATEDEARERLAWIDEHIYRNPEEVARFLGMCVEEAKKLSTFPKNLTGEDFAALVEQQKDAVDEVLDEVFLHYVDFTFITLQTLYAMYVARAKALNPGASPLSQQNFNGRIQAFIRASAKHVAKSEKRQRVKVDGVTAMSTVYYAPSKVAASDCRFEQTSVFLSGSHLASTPQQAKVQQLRHSIVPKGDDTYYQRLHEQADRQREEWLKSGEEHADR